VIENPPVLAIPAPQPVVDREGPPLRHRLVVRFERGLAIVGVHAVDPAVGQIVLRSTSRHVEPAPVEVGAPGVGPGHPDHQRSGVRQQSEPVFALARRALGPTPSQGVGEDLRQELEPLDQLVRPVALRAKRAERERADGDAFDDQAGRPRTIGWRVPAGCAGRPGRARKLVDPRHRDHMTGLKARGDPGERLLLHRSGDGDGPFTRPRMRDLDDVGAPVVQLGEHRSVRLSVPTIRSSAFSICPATRARAG